MQLTSAAFADSAEIPQRHGKKIDNISPPLSWADAPAGVQSFALSVVDWHPVARNYVHWLVVDLGPDVSALAENAATGRMPAGAREHLEADLRGEIMAGRDDAAPGHDGRAGRELGLGIVG